MKEDEKAKALSLLGKLGGSARTEAKAEAARANGVKGGRPFRIEFESSAIQSLLFVLRKDLAKLKRFKDDDPKWDRWNESIADGEALIEKIDSRKDRIDLTKTDVITLVQLLAQYIGRTEKNGRDDFTVSEKSLEAALVAYFAVAKQLDALLGQPSVFEHYLREARRQ